MSEKIKTILANGYQFLRFHVLEGMKILKPYTTLKIQEMRL